MTPNTCRRELLHYEGRYFLPYPISSLSDDTEVVGMDDISTEYQVVNLFDSSCQESYTGKAWVVEIG